MKFFLYYAVGIYHGIRYLCKMLKYGAFLLFMFLVAGCSEKPFPKPKGELRLEYPKPEYQVFDGELPFVFEYSHFAKVAKGKNTGWYNISYPKMNAYVFMTFFNLKNDLEAHIKESEKMVYKHTIKATSIQTQSFSFPKKKVYGNFYILSGPTASNVQFYITDSTKYFVTGDLSFNTRPKPDSLAPAVDYIKNDLQHLIDTFQWKQQ
ncbi:gliding motility lipoprotein GldD [Riemerella columbipharyngis]|uniref:Gliding motility-associated lipoprotein GldD n=2 Tax=Riemerella columbipharyngis TaxID=1071918 RepID=A0A1G7DSE0_9FLAO|nr:gliding motility lipoprotein GldD [Riemerella columbipharyngis]SDE53805.1 gliding motility-associated lipoprotein GldD [Riemerella columbipharyngis]